MGVIRLVKMTIGSIILQCIEEAWVTMMIFWQIFLSRSLCKAKNDLDGMNSGREGDMKITSFTGEFLHKV